MNGRFTLEDLVALLERLCPTSVVELHDSYAHVVCGGVDYDADKGLSPVWENPRFTPRAIAPQVSLEGGTATTRCSVRPQLSIMLFDAAGPTLTPDLAAKLDASGPRPLKATLTGEIGLDVGGKMEIFGKNLGEVNYHLFTVDKQLWKYPN